MASKTDANGNTETLTCDTCPTTNATECVRVPGQLVQATFGSKVGPNDLSFTAPVRNRTLNPDIGHHRRTALP